MVAGFDRYYQIVRCFRDEDLRADRQPEFTQVDLEMSFASEETVIALIEGMMADLFQKALGKEIPLPMPRLEYQDALERFGTDRPDTRFGLEMKDVTDLVRGSGFRVFKDVAESGGRVKAITIEKGASLFSRKILDELSQLVVSWGGKGLMSAKVTDDGWQSSLDKFLQNEEKTAINRRVAASSGDLLLIAAGKPKEVSQVLGMLRLEVAKRLSLIKSDAFSFVWVTRFPLFEYDETEGRLSAVHHPFTSPLDEDVPLLRTDPEKARARAYDIVLNGSEIGGGSVRIHNTLLQDEIFRILGISREEADMKFGFFLEALKYGAPPHAGIALGFDRLVAILTGAESIREVIAFPKTQTASCPLTEAPSSVDSRQLEELGLSLLPR
jgi:aspartyl-tRNA synthetase